MSAFSSSSSPLYCTGILFWQRNDHRASQKQILMLKKKAERKSKKVFISMAKWLDWGRWKMPLRETCPLQYFGVSLAGIKIKSKRWSFVSWFFTQRLLFHVMKMLTKENNRKDCLTLYQHKMCSIVLIEAICFQGWRSVVIKQPIFVTWLYFGLSHIT